MLNADQLTKENDELLYGFARQGFTNEYLYNLDQEEQTTLNAIEDSLCSPAQEFSNSKQWRLTALLLMYKSPLELPALYKIPELDSSTSFIKLHRFISQVKTDQMNELQLADTFLEQSALRDETSEKVAAMYEQNPYPRWTHNIVNQNPKRLSFTALFDLEKSPAYHQPGSSIKSILVAGCGTGRHPLTLAKNFPELAITAIDISCRSLAYAALKAKQLNITNIEFKRCDILALHEWQKQFDIVDSTGVIHHMADPEAGLAALMTRLKPGGILRLGLYSSAARRDIIRYRQQHSVDDLDAKKIRFRRLQLVDKIAQGEYCDLINFGDFYAMSGCRDLLMHEQESQYTIDEVRQLLAAQDLQFLRMVNGPAVENALTRLCGPDATPYSLDDWQSAEDKEHFLFYNMYNFYAQKSSE